MVVVLDKRRLCASVCVAQRCIDPASVVQALNSCSTQPVLCFSMPGAAKNCATAAADVVYIFPRAAGPFINKVNSTALLRVPRACGWQLLVLTATAWSPSLHMPTGCTARDHAKACVSLQLSMHAMPGQLSPQDAGVVPLVLPSGARVSPCMLQVWGPAPADSSFIAFTPEEQAQAQQDAQV